MCIRGEVFTRNILTDHFDGQSVWTMGFDDDLKGSHRYSTPLPPTSPLTDPLPPPPPPIPPN